MIMTVKNSRMSQLPIYWNNFVQQVKRKPASQSKSPQPKAEPKQQLIIKIDADALALAAHYDNLIERFIPQEWRTWMRTTYDWLKEICRKNSFNDILEMGQNGVQEWVAVNRSRTKGWNYMHLTGNEVMRTINTIRSDESLKSEDKSSALI